MNVRLDLVTTTLLSLVTICPAVYGEDASPPENEAESGSSTSASAEHTDSPAEANTELTATLQAPDRRNQARQHFQRGMALVRERRWEAALTAFNASLELYPTQSALFNSGICSASSVALSKLSRSSSSTSRNTATPSPSPSEGSRNAPSREIVNVSASSRSSSTAPSTLKCLLTGS